MSENKIKPKRATCSYLFFTNSKRPNLMKAGLKVTEVSKKCGELWKQMSDAQKKPFEAL